MKLFRLWRYDCRSSFRQEYKKWLAALLLWVAIVTLFSSRRAGLMRLCHASSTTAADYLYYVFMGAKPAYDSNFRFPALWLLVMSFGLFLVLTYPYTDLRDHGKLVLISSGSRVRWWLSKCGWTVSCVVLYFVMFWAVVPVASLLTGASLSTTVSPFMLEGVLSPTPTAELRLFGLTMGMPVLVLATLALVQLTLSLFLRPLYSFCVCFAVLVCSVFRMHPALLGNFAMIARYDLFSDGVCSAGMAVPICIGVSLAAIVGGAAAFSRMDILNGED